MKKLIVIFSLFTLIPLTSIAASNLENCRGLWDRLVGPNTSNWTNCFGEITFEDGRAYSGEWQQGKKSGQGTFSWPNGMKYIGQFQNNVRWGTGTMYFSPEESYTGEYKNDVREGQGLYTNTNGDNDGLTSYSGQWVGDEYYGTGTAIFKDGRKFQGNFIKKSGNGSIFYPNGDRYSGQWDQSWRRSGQGKIVYVNGTSYSGEWSGDSKQGNGTFTSSDSTYSGYWDHDQKAGQGKLYLATGDKYFGQFNNNKYNGKGTYIWKNGDKYDGEWADGMLNGRGIRTFSSKTPTQDGFWRDNKFIGTVEQIRQQEQARKNAEETQKAVNCGLYKLVRFSCASAGSVETCLSLRFGSDYMAYEWMCR
jgi:hypothetical protein